MVSDEAVEKATGKSLATWFAWFDRIGGRDLPHAELALRVGDAHGVSGWWSQMLSVEYERHIGRRVVGQGCDGTFRAAATKTVPGSMDDALALWTDHADGLALPLQGAPRISITEKWRYWRATLEDGTKLNVVIRSKPGHKSQIAINHERLADQDAVAASKAQWRTVLKAL